MGKILFFIAGIIAGISLAAILYLQASAKYDTALEGNSASGSITSMSEAQTIWPPYIIDTRFQNNLNRLREKNDSGPNVTIRLKKEADTEDTQNLVNQLEVMEGVEEVRWNTLGQPVEYIHNMTRLPDSKDEIRDNIVIVTNSAKTVEEVTEFAKLQEIVESVSTLR